eukprot:m.81698 g.81698  ORF g.81698 m.81698 type:complete len:124 (+) comp14577_c0_seq18:95-466(+)
MAKSLRSKVKRKFRTIKRTKIVNKAQKAIEEKIEEVRQNPSEHNSVTLTTLAKLKTSQEKQQAKEDGTTTGSADEDMDVHADASVSKSQLKKQRKSRQFKHLSGNRKRAIERKQKKGSKSIKW